MIKLDEYFRQSLYDVRTDVCDIFEKYGSDKSGWHNYSTMYNFLFKDRYDDELNIFEVGLGTNNPNIPSNMGIYGKPGASLYAWREIFKNSKIYGADVDKDILFGDTNIKTFYVDQTKRMDIQHMWDNIGDVSFDIIVDDGLHEFDANITFLENSFHKLKKGGYYIIEDIVKTPYLDHFVKYFSSSEYVYQIVDIPMTAQWNNGRINDCDNVLIIIEKL